jgi:glycosyltransferase involved in cell wall biosynthesis
MKPRAVHQVSVGYDYRGAPSPRILHVAQPTDGGVRRYLVAACADQIARGWQVVVACPEGPLAVDLDALGVPRRSWSATRSPGPSIVGETLALSRIVDDIAPDLVHLHSSKAGLVGRLVVRRHRPTIFQPHGWSWLAATSTVKRLTLRWERLASRWSTAIVCVGHDELAAGQDAGIRAPMRVVRNGVDRARFAVAGEAAKSRARRELDIPDDAALVVCAGRVTRQKGQDVLLAAWPSVRARCANAQLAIVGDGDMLAELRRHADSSIRFVPPTPDIARWLAAADVVTVPSRWEGLPLIALEAAAVGRGVVGTAVAGLTESVTPETGVLVAPESPDALADALARRLCEPSLAAAEGRAAATLAAQFDQRHTLEELAQLALALVGADGSMRAQSAEEALR